MIQIPVFNSIESDWQQKITLGPQEISVRFSWNARVGCWFVDLDDQQGNLIYSRKLVPLMPLLYNHRALMPIVGDFVLIAESGAATEYPTFDSLGTSHNLYWLDATELATWEAALGI